MVHIIIEVPRRDFSNILLTKPFQQSPISVLEAPSNRFEITDIPIAFRDQVCVFGQTFDRKMVEGELTVDCSFCLEQAQRIILGNLTSANDRGFARSLDDVAFLGTIPNAAIPILTAANFIYRHAAIDLYCGKICGHASGPLDIE